MGDELSSIGAEIESLTIALQSIEQGLMKLSDRMNNMDISLKNNGNELEDRFKCMDEILDGKVSTFQEVIEASVEKQIAKLTTDLNNKVRGVKEVFNDFKKDMEDKVNNFTCSCSGSCSLQTNENENENEQQEQASVSGLTDNKPRVVNLNNVQNKRAWLNDTNNVYIGRANVAEGIEASKWANLNIVEEHGRETAVLRYEEDLKNNVELLGSIGELSGKNLLCWCDPLLCHGDVLLWLANNSATIENQPAAINEMQQDVRDERDENRQ